MRNGDYPRDKRPAGAQLCNRRRLLAGIVGLFDDSGTDLQGPVVVLAGVAIESDTLTEFSRAWELALAEHPKIKYLKMSEAGDFRGEFKDWEAGDRNAKLLRLAEALRPYAVLGYGAGLTMPDYQAVIGKLRLRRVNPYIVLFHQVVYGLGRELVDDPCCASIRFVFDEQGKPGKRAAKALKAIWHCVPEEIRLLIPEDPEFKDEKIFLPLQAADLMAWCIRRRLDADFGFASEPVEIFEILSDSALSTVNCIVHGITRSELTRKEPGFIWAFRDEIPEGGAWVSSFRPSSQGR
jgi:hypothetical protein